MPNESVLTYKIAIVVEGSEEECLFSIASACGYINSCFEVFVFNAGGEGSVPSYFQDKYADPHYDCALAVYDVDNKYNGDKTLFNLTREKLLSIIGNKQGVNSVSFCTNPNILQILLLGCDSLDKVSLVSTSKKANTNLVSHYWPQMTPKVKNGKQIKGGYDASEWQLKMIKDSFQYDDKVSFKNILENSKVLDREYTKSCPASNVQMLLSALESGNIEFFKKIAKNSKKGE